MRISVFICLAFMGSVFAEDAYSQAKKYSVTLKNTTIRQAISEIEQQTDCFFIVADEVSDELNRIVDLSITKKELSEILGSLFTGTNLLYMISGRQVLVSKSESEVEIAKLQRLKEEEPEDKSEALQGILITGTVTDEAGEPLPGVNVIVKGTTTGTVSDIDGRYRINVPNTDAELTFTFIGYSEQTISVGDRIIINVTMIEGAVAIEEVEVIGIGYGSIRQRDVTGAVTVADIGEMQKMPVGTILEGLAGRVSGVQIISTDGTPGQSSSVVIRGGNTINGNNNPLYVVDGFPQVENFDLNVLDPSEIESLVVLKDASSTAIYGSRGANGVIIVTTKRGAIGKPVITYRGVYGTQDVAKRMDVMSPYDFVAMELERNANRANNGYLKDRTLDSYKDVQGTDWQDKLLRTAWMQTHTLSVRGGNESTKYNFTGAYHDQDGVIITSNYKRYNVRMDLDQQLFKWLKGGVSLNYTRTVYTGAQPSLTLGNTTSSVTYFTLFNAWGYMPVSSAGLTDEDFEQEPLDPDITEAGDNRVNPILSTRNEYRKGVVNIFSVNAYLDFKITEKLSFKTIGQVYQNLGRSEEFNNSLTRSFRSVRAVNGNVSNTDNSNWVNENILTYFNTFSGGHRLNATGAVTFEKYSASTYGYTSEHIPNEEKGLSGIDEGNVYTQNAFIDPGTSRVSLLGRIIYDYRSRYLATVSMRADASGKFAKGNRWGYFPSASLAWRFSEEEFLSNQSILSNGKLRGSWGWTGNDRISSSERYPQLTTPTNQLYPLNSGGTFQNASYIGTPGNPALKWERTVQTNIGIDLGFLKDRIALVVDVYRKNTHDLLLDTPLPGSAGYTSVRKNIGQMQNQGLEIMLSTVNMNSKSFQWKTIFNISFNQNKVVELADDQPILLRAVTWDQDFNQSTCYAAKVGGPVAQIFGYVWDGLYQNDEFIYAATGIPTLRPDVPAYTTNHMPGDIKYKDINGDGVVNDQDRQAIGNTQPLHQGGISNVFSYKSFDLSVFFRWSYGSEVLNANRLIMEAGDRIGTNQFSTFVNRWTPDHQNTTMHRLGSNGIRSFYSSRVVEDASFLRLQTIAFGYSLPRYWLQKVSISSARLSLALNNLYTWTNYSGYDPEVSARHTILTPNFDFSTCPRPRTVSLTLNVGF